MEIKKTSGKFSSKGKLRKKPFSYKLINSETKELYNTTKKIIESVGTIDNSTAEVLFNYKVRTDTFVVEADIEGNTYYVKMPQNFVEFDENGWYVLGDFEKRDNGIFFKKEGIELKVAEIDDKLKQTYEKVFKVIEHSIEQEVFEVLISYQYPEYIERLKDRKEVLASILLNMKNNYRIIVDKENLREKFERIKEKIEIKEKENVKKAETEEKETVEEKVEEKKEGIVDKIKGFVKGIEVEANIKLKKKTKVGDIEATINLGKEKRYRAAPLIDKKTNNQSSEIIEIKNIKEIAIASLKNKSKKKYNEDVVGAYSGKNKKYIIVADGMGGLEKSNIISNTIVDHVLKRAFELDKGTITIERVIGEIKEKINSYDDKGDAVYGIIEIEGDKAKLYLIGDITAYRIRNNKIEVYYDEEATGTLKSLLKYERLDELKNYFEENKEDRNKEYNKKLRGYYNYSHIVSSSAKKTEYYFYQEVDLKKGDILIMTTDGFSDQFGSKKILSMLEGIEHTPKEIAIKLMSEAAKKREKNEVLSKDDDIGLAVYIY